MLPRRVSCGGDRRQGQTALSPDIRLVRLVVRDGTFVDLSTDTTQADWGISTATLTASNPSAAEESQCLEVARAVRARCDFLKTPSARGKGLCAPLYPDRHQGTLNLELSAVIEGRAPLHLQQQPTEQW